MRFLRWALAVYSGFVFLIVGTATILAQRVNETLLNDGFYITQLRQADLFNFFYDQALPALLVDLTTDIDEDGMDLDTVSRELVNALRTALPPDWLEKQTEEAIREIVPYLVGNTESFIITVPLRARVIAAAQAAKNLSGSDAVLNLIFDQVLGDVLAESLPGEGQPESQSGLTLNLQDLQPRLRSLLDNSWVHARVSESVDVVVPYLVGDSESFAVRFTLADRKESLRHQLSALLETWDATAFIETGVLDQLITGSVSQGGYQVTFGQRVTPEDIRDSLKDSASRAWLQAQSKELVSSTLDYLLGNADTLSVTISLGKIKETASRSIGEVLDSRLAAAYAAAPLCIAQIDPSSLERDGITCSYPGVNYEQLKEAAGIRDLPARVAGAVSAGLPSELVLAEGGLPFGVKWRVLEDARKWILEGFTFTDRQLEELLARAEYPESSLVPFDQLGTRAKAQFIGSSARLESLHTFRGYLKNSYSFTDQDLRRLTGPSNAASGEVTLDRLRETVGAVTRYSFLLWLFPPLLLVPVILWGGHTTSERVIWGASFVLILGMILLAFAGPAYPGAARERIMSVVQESVETPESGRSHWEVLVRKKGVQIAGNAIDSFAGSISAKGLALFLFSIPAIGVAAWYQRSQRRPQSPV